MSPLLPLTQINQLYNEMLAFSKLNVFIIQTPKTIGQKILSGVFVISIVLIANVWSYFQILHYKRATNLLDKSVVIGFLTYPYTTLAKVYSVLAYRRSLFQVFLQFDRFNCNHHSPLLARRVLSKAYFVLYRARRLYFLQIFFNMSVWLICPLVLSREMFGFVTRDGTTLDELVNAMPITDGSNSKSVTRFFKYILDLINANYTSIFLVEIDMVLVSSAYLLYRQSYILAESLRTDHLPLSLFIQDHVQLIQKARSLGRVLSVIVGAEITEVFLVNGCCLTALASAPDLGNKSAGALISFYLKFIVFLLIPLARLFMLCWFGLIINTGNAGLNEALYDSPWHTLPPNKSNNWILPIFISQKKTTFKALGMVSTDLNLFVAVFRASYSYFALMRNSN